MKRKKFALAAVMLLSMTAGCAGNTNSQALQVTSAPVTANVEQSAAAIQEIPESSGAAAQVQKNATQPVMETALGSITMEEAKAIALEDAGVTGENMSYSSAKLDRENGQEIYEVDFSKDEAEYEYEIRVSDGTILKKKQDFRRRQNSGTQSANQTENRSVESLTMEQARQKVAERIPGIDAANIYIKEDYEDGRLQYEGEAYYNNAKYEFELDAATGTFYDWEVETGK